MIKPNEIIALITISPLISSTILFINKIKVKVSTEFYRSANILEKIIKSPGKNNDLLQLVQNKINEQLPSAYVSTIANQHGEKIIANFYGNISETYK